MSDASADSGQGAAASAASPSVTPVTPTSTGAVATPSTSAALTAVPTSTEPPAPTSQQVAPAPSPAPASPNAPDWLKDADETLVGYVQNKGWTEPRQVLDGYRNLEKLLGADKAGNAVVIPKAEADAKEWAAVYDKLGRPSAPDGYKVELPEGGDANVQSAVLAKFHELGLSKTQGEQLANWYNNLSVESIKAAEAERAQQFQQDDSEIKMLWGAAYNQNLAQAQAAARGLALDGQTIDKLSEALGHKGTMQLLQRIGSRMSEDRFVASDSPGGFSNALTPGQAKAQIQSLMSDRDFTTRYLAGNAEAKAKMEALHKFAFPEG